MTSVKLCVAKRYAAQTELPVFLTGEPADLTVFPEGFLRSAEDLALVLDLTRGSMATVLTGYRDGDLEKAVIIENGQVVDEYVKCILTAGERAKKRPGERIRCLQSRLGKIAAPICYEVHFPEVCRLMALESPILMVNPVGTGMYHDRQYRQWLALARARAIENELPVVGCCHDCGEIPLAFGFDSHGETLLETKGCHGAFTLELDLEQAHQRPINYFADRRPELFSGLSVNK